MLFFTMNRKLREKCFLDTLDTNLTNVEISLNHIDDILNKEYAIDEEFLKADLEKSFYDLEIHLSLLAVTLRKMSENQFITIDDVVRKDLNSLIHSCKFIYKDHNVYAYSRKGAERIDLERIYEFIREILEKKV